MRKRTSHSELRVQSQGRTYAAVLGVTVGMLFAGLAVPLAFGRVPGGTSSSGSVQLDPGFSSGETPSALSSPGAVAGPGGSPTAPGASGLPTLAPVGGTTGTVPTSNPGSGSGGGGTAPSAPGRVTLRATDQGVTATTVKLGVVLIDIRALAPLGFSQPHFTPQEQQRQFQVFIDQVNKTGGLSGRKIVPDYKTYNALDSNGPNSAGAVCIQLAQDDKVFAAIGVLNGGIDVCLTQQYGIPAIGGYSALVESYRKGRNLLVTPFASLERLASDWGDLAARSGVLKGRKVGTVSTAIPEEAKPESSLVKALAADGQSVTYRAHLSAESGTAQSQLPIEVQKMKSAGVDTVFLVTNFAAGIQFVQTAERQSWRPRYVVSDVGQYQAEGLVQTMPASFNGAYLFTQGHSLDPKDPENAQDRQCRTSFNAATGNHYGVGNESGGTYLFCWMVTVFSQAARNVGADLTRPAQATAFQHLSIPLGHTLGGSFRPGKTDYADLFRTASYVSSCKCYKATGGAPTPGRY